MPVAYHSPAGVFSPAPSLGFSEAAARHVIGGGGFPEAPLFFPEEVPGLCVLAQARCTRKFHACKLASVHAAFRILT